MPTYDYQCPNGHAFERFQKITEKPRARCPTCGRWATRQISGGAGLVFKGSGFYITDYGKDGKGPRRPKDSSTEDKKTSSDTAQPSDKPKDAPGGSKAKPSPQGNE